MEPRNRDSIIPFVIKMARAYDPAPAHNEQVTILALALFDGLRILHGYNSGERRLLEIASRLHDIGWSRTVSGKHHKLSCGMIQELDIPGLDKQDRFTCALVARYHTKAPPDASRHRRFKSLDNGQRTVVEWLAGMLRVADGLDCNHANIIRQLTCTVSGKVVTIHLEVTGNCRKELARASQKRDLLTKITGRKIEFRC